MSKTKCYPHVTGLYGDQGENPSALAIHAVLDPSPNYPENGRIIVGSPATTPTIPGHIPNLGGFNGGPAAIERLASTLLEAARDVRAAIGWAADPEQFSAIAELAKWRRWASELLGDDGLRDDDPRRARIGAVMRAAVAFVDEQGKRVDGQYGLADAGSFALDQWRDMVAAVEAAGR